MASLAESFHDGRAHLPQSHKEPQQPRGGSGIKAITICAAHQQRKLRVTGQIVQEIIARASSWWMLSLPSSISACKSTASAFIKDTKPGAAFFPSMTGRLADITVKVFKQQTRYPMRHTSFEAKNVPLKQIRIVPDLVPA